MKIFKLMVVALVAMLGFTACDKDCDHDFIEHDFTQDIVGTWTTLNGELAEAMVIKADGSFTTTGVMKGGSLYEEKGTIKVVNNKVTLAFDGDKETFEGRLEFVAGKSMSLVMFDDNAARLTYDYCENDLSDEIIGMWVCTDAPTENGETMIVHTFMDNGKAIYTGFGTRVDEYLLNEETTYEVVGDLLFYALPKDKLAEGEDSYITKKLAYKPNGAAYGDIMEEKTIKSTSTMLRIKQSLDLTGKTYDYSSAYVTSAKGKDEDFTIMGNTFNIAKIKAYDFDKMFSANLFCVELNANSFKYKLRLDNGQYTGFDTPMTIDGNKVTLDMSAINPALRKVEMHMFQDANDTQVHFYMHTDAFINYFANMEVYTLIMEGKINPTDAAAIEKVYTDMEARIESINVSFVMKARK